MGCAPLLGLDEVLPGHAPAALLRLDDLALERDPRRRARRLGEEPVQLGPVLVRQGRLARLGVGFALALGRTVRRTRGRVVLARLEARKEALELVGDAILVGGPLGRRRLVGLVLLAEDEDRLADLDEAVGVELERDLDRRVGEVVGGEVGARGRDAAQVDRREVA